MEANYRCAVQNNALKANKETWQLKDMCLEFLRSAVLIAASCVLFFFPQVSSIVKKHDIPRGCTSI